MKGSINSQMRQSFPSLLIMIVMVVGASIASENFLTLHNIQNVLTQMSVLAIVSISQAIVLLSGGIDMSVSSIISMSTVIIALISTTNALGVPLAIFVALCSGTLVGFINGIGIVKFHIPAMIITIAMQALVKGISLILMPRSGGSVERTFCKFIKLKLGVLTVASLLAVILYIVFFLVLHFTRFGRDIYALGNGKVYAEQSGINTSLLTIRIYMVSGLISALAGIILAARISSGNALVGDSYAMDSVAAGVIGGISMNGGIGTVVGALFGTAILSLINNIMNSLGISPYYQYIIKGLLLMVSLMLFQLKRRKAS